METKLLSKRKSSYWSCDACRRSIEHGEYRYNCTVCHDYDYCQSCMKERDSVHEHPMVKELAYGRPEYVEKLPSNMGAGIQTAVEMYKDRYCMGVRNVRESGRSCSDDCYSWITYETVGKRVEHFGYGLRSILQPRNYVGICAKNRPEWVITDFACMVQNFISVPIYSSFSDSEIAYVLNNAKIPLVVCDEDRLPRFISIAKECSNLRCIVSMDIPSRDMIDAAKLMNLSIYSMDELERIGRTQKYESSIMQPTDPMTIIYTSGSTGFPKGAIISEQAYRNTFTHWLDGSLIERITLSYRPLAWASDRDSLISSFLAGGRIAFSTGDINCLMDEIAIVRPTRFSGVPSIWNKLFAEYQATLSTFDFVQSSDSQLTKEEFLLRKFSKLFGNRCQLITVGSAKISPVVLDFIKNCFRQCNIYESYGITECGGVALDEELDRGVEYRLESVPEMGYTVDDRPHPRGEIVVKTSQMFSGYLNNPEETAATMTEDGFYRTGDIVEIEIQPDGNKKIRVIDRRKNLMKLSHGQFVSPEYLQGIFIQSPFVEQIYVHADILDDCVSAVVVPNREYSRAFIKKQGLNNFDENNPDPAYVDAILEDLRSIGKRQSVKTFEIPSHVVVDFQAFTVEKGLLTPSFKQCRYRLAQYYGDRLREARQLDRRLQLIINKATGHEILDDENLFYKMGGDSLTAQRLSRGIEHELGISIPPNLLFSEKMNLKRLTALLRDPSQITASSVSLTPQLMNDVQFDFEIKIKSIKLTSSHPSTVFVTGATGFIGAFLLAELLEKYPVTCKFICLVRLKPSRNTINPIREQMSMYCLWKDSYQQRIIMLNGDLSKPCLGLTNEAYQRIAERIDLIFHCGAVVNFVLPYHHLYDANVFGTKEIIRLAVSQTRAIPIQYISTISVLSSIGTHEVSIDQVTPDRLTSGYAQSKWVAEKLMSKAMAFGLPVTIYRLGSITASTRTGACNPTDIQTALLSALIRTCRYPHRTIDHHLVGIPVDLTVMGIVHLSLTASSDQHYGNTYHLLHPSFTVSMRDIVRSLSSSDTMMRSVTDQEWNDTLQILITEHRSFETTIPFLLDCLTDGKTPFDCSEYRQAVSGLNFTSMNQDYVAKWIQFVRANFAH